MSRLILHENRSMMPWQQLMQRHGEWNAEQNLGPAGGLLCAEHVASEQKLSLGPVYVLLSNVQGLLVTTSSC